MITRFLCYLIPPPLIFCLSFFSGILYFYGFSDIAIAVFLFPIAEELFKFLCAKFIPKFAFGTIVSYAVFEFALVKMPHFDRELGMYNLDILLFSIASMIFHIGTAYAYLENRLRNYQFLTFIVMVSLHIFYNYLSEVDMPRIMSFIVYAISCLLPFIYLRATKFFVSNDAATAAS
jgi:hypothetical protein